MNETLQVRSESGCAESVAIFTVCNIAYLPRAMVLARSLLRHAGRRLRIIVFDKKTTVAPVVTAEADLTWVEDLGIPRLSELAFMYDIIEFSTALKPYIALQLLEAHDFVVFLDPDTCVFDTLEPVIDDVRRHPIVLTPHYTTPQPSQPSESDLAMMRFGSFNLGFFAVSKAEEGLKFLQWWSARCLDHCFMESQFGLSVDQKWVSIAPCFFKDLYVSFNLGYNAAPWNTFERDITRTADGRYVVNDRFPLIFFHFSNFDAQDPQYLNKRASNERGRHYPAVLELGTAYGAALLAASAEIDNRPYSFDYMSNGAYISPTLRRAYAAVREELPPGHDPFDAAGPVGKFVRRNGLAAKNGRRYSYPKLTDVNNHKVSLAVIYWIMRRLLRLMGANRFYDLSKLMVLLSVYRRNRALWKL